MCQALATQWMKLSHWFAGSDALTRNVVWEVTPDFRWEIALVCSAMFFGCMVCHGELARLKPDPSRLTEFYLMMSAGGALGGLFRLPGGAKAVQYLSGVARRAGRPRWALPHWP